MPISPRCCHRYVRSANSSTGRRLRMPSRVIPSPRPFCFWWTDSESPSRGSQTPNRPASRIGPTSLTAVLKIARSHVDAMISHARADHPDEACGVIIVVYHSHTATEAYPSRTDISLAAEPQAHYVLVSTAESGNQDGPVEIRSYRILDRVVTEEEIEITE